MALFYSVGGAGDVGVGFGLGFLCDAGSLVARVGVGRAEGGVGAMSRC